MSFSFVTLGRFDIDYEQQSNYCYFKSHVSCNLEGEHLQVLMIMRAGYMH